MKIYDQVQQEIEKEARDLRKGRVPKNISRPAVGEVTFTLTISREVSEGLEAKRRELGLRSRSETIRVLLAEALK